MAFPHKQGVQGLPPLPGFKRGVPFPINLFLLMDNIQRNEDENPDEVHEVPVEASNFNGERGH